jgi:tRNA (adenine22-N1)-methyltransferase
MLLRKLGPRLEAVASFIPEGKRVADIGTDHGLLPIHLRRLGISPAVIASDLRPGPLDSAMRNARRFGAEKITFRLCAGLEGYRQDEADVVVIAGMSGETIRSILEKAAWDWTGKQLILEANTKHPELLTWLYQNGMHIVGERIPEENGRPYRVYCAESGEAPVPRPAYLWGGFRDSPYARRQAALLRGALKGLDTAVDPADQQRRKEYRIVLEDMKDAYHWDDTE